MPKVESAADTTEIAAGFLKSHYRILQGPLSAKLDLDKCAVEIDMGPFFNNDARRRHGNISEADLALITDEEIAEGIRPAVGRLLELVGGKVTEV